MILARWLMGLTVALAAEHPDDLHAQLLVFSSLSLLAMAETK